MAQFIQRAARRVDVIAAAELLQRLIRFDTTNPPGNERACIEYLAHVLREAGFEPRLVARDEARPNLIARLPGRGSAPPLLLQGHVDVVTTAGQQWQHPPFGGEIVDGEMWGRGALDMKGGVAMMVGALLRASAEGTVPAGDVILCLLADEESGGSFGARFLVEEHPELFPGVRYALGEFGGFTMELGGRRFFPIMVGEKQAVELRATIRGPGGHGSLPLHGGAMARLARMLRILDRRRLPVHITPPVRATFEALAAEASFPLNRLAGGMLNPRLTDRILDLLGARGAGFDPMLHHTVNATMVRGGEKINVIPSEVTVDLDCRLLPGFRPDDAIDELHTLLGNDIQFEVLAYDPGPSSGDLKLFPLLGDILRSADRSGIPLPIILPAVTDARFFARLGIQSYGFLPMTLPPELRFTEIIHAADERIPVAALEFGTNAMYEVIGRYEG